MPLTEAGKKATQRYLKKFDDIKIRVPKGEREIYSSHAASQGESLNAFIRRAIRETMERDNSSSKIKND